MEEGADYKEREEELATKESFSRDWQTGDESGFKHRSLFPSIKTICSGSILNLR